MKVNTQGRPLQIFLHINQFVKYVVRPHWSNTLAKINIKKMVSTEPSPKPAEKTPVIVEYSVIPKANITNNDGQIKPIKIQPYKAPTNIPNTSMPKADI